MPTNAEPTGVSDGPSAPSLKMGWLVRSRIMYIENKADLSRGEARIGRVSFSKSGMSLYYRGRTFRSLNGRGFKANYFDVETGEEFWISGPRKDGEDRLYGGGTGVVVDDDVREEYWRDIRGVAPGGG